MVCTSRHGEHKTRAVRFALVRVAGPIACAHGPARFVGARARTQRALARRVVALRRRTARVAAKLVGLARGTREAAALCRLVTRRHACAAGGVRVAIFQDRSLDAVSVGRIAERARITARLVPAGVVDLDHAVRREVCELSGDNRVRGDEARSGDDLGRVVSVRASAKRRPACGVPSTWTRVRRASEREAVGPRS